MDAARGIDRRTVLRVGAAAAWSAPLVQTVTAAPAFAVSGPATLTVAPVTVDRANGLYTIKLIVMNSGGSATQALKATLTSSLVVLNPSVLSGWTGSGPSWNASPQIAAGGSKSFDLTFSVAQADIGKANTVTVTFATSGKNATQAIFSKSFPQTV